MIIGLSGKKQSGKDTAAKIIISLLKGHTQNEILYNSSIVPTLSNNNIQLYRFADAVKECASIILNVNKELFENNDFKQQKIGKDWGNLTYRDFLQKFGTEVGRAINPNIWLNVVKNKIDKNKHTIIADVRFVNECDMIHEMGGIIIRLERNTGIIDKHISETELDGYEEFDYVVENNGSLGDLIRILDNIVKYESI